MHIVILLEILPCWLFYLSAQLKTTKLIIPSACCLHVVLSTCIWFHAPLILDRPPVIWTRRISRRWGPACLSSGLGTYSAAWTTSPHGYSQTTNSRSSWWGPRAAERGQSIKTQIYVSDYIKPSFVLMHQERTFKVVWNTNPLFVIQTPWNLFGIYKKVHSVVLANKIDSPREYFRVLYL